MRAVVLDALGTLLELEDPAPRLVVQLRDRGVEVTLEQAQTALGVEMGYYRAHHDEATDAERLADLRRRCADVLASALPEQVAGLGTEEITQALLTALRFRPYPEVPDVLAQLRSLPESPRLVVLSNWDVSLHEQLALTALDTLVDAAISSAEIGVSKPHPDAFAAALALVGAAPHEAVMVGDSADADIHGALAAGLRAVFVDRGVGGPAAPGPPSGVPVIGSFAELARHVSSRA